MEDILVPIFVCVVLPVAVVLITSLTKMNVNKSRTQLLMKAIEVNKDVDVERLVELLRQSRQQPKTPEELLNLRLLRGCIFSTIGMVLILTALILLLTGTMFYSEIIGFTMLPGGLSLAIGISYLLVCRLTRNQIKSQAESTDTATRKDI
ncbi:MAG: hypothetical protein K2H47_05820 [Muribaculaceae bacterium]|nr:hypothetical protein [Muribaculaceae bacterium]